LFGESVESLSSESSAASSDFADHFNTALDGLSFRATIGPFRLLHFSAKFRESVQAARGFVHCFAQKALEYRATLESEKHPANSVESHTQYVFLHELAKQTSDTNEITDQLLNILLAGRDTTASLLSMVFYVLSRRPDVWETLRREVISLNGECPSFEQLKHMKYLSWVINESMYGSIH
jgi:cytochrome P450